MRHENLEQLLAHIWSTVYEGSQKPEHPYHTPAFGTVGAQEPSLRTVILRAVDPEARTLLFHSDRRAQKIADIQNHQRVSWLFWNAASKKQLRLKGEATLHFDDSLAQQVWNDSRPQSLKLYVKPIKPNTKVDFPDSGLEPSVRSLDLTNHEQIAAGREHFAVVSTQVNEIDFLHLHREGNYRARFVWNPGLESAWIIP